MPDNSPKKQRRYDLWGWLLFVISALIFMASSIRAGDAVGFFGGVFFLLACAAFLASYTGVKRADPNSQADAKTNCGPG